VVAAAEAAEAVVAVAESVVQVAGEMEVTETAALAAAATER
jgi:hypothetical protein